LTKADFQGVNFYDSIEMYRHYPRDFLSIFLKHQASMAIDSTLFISREQNANHRQHFLQKMLPKHLNELYLT